MNVFIGDTAAYEYAQQNPSTFLQSTGTAPGIHPANSTRTRIWVAMWATAIANGCWGQRRRRRRRRLLEQRDGGLNAFRRR